MQYTHLQQFQKNIEEQIQDNKKIKLHRKRIDEDEIEIFTFLFQFWVF